MGNEGPVNPGDPGTSEVDVLNEGGEELEKVDEEGGEEETPGEEEVDTEGKEEEEEEEEPELEEEEIEKEFEEEEEEEEEELDEKLITRPSWKELKEKFPGIEKNKDFKEMYFSEREYRNVFPTVQDAKDAYQASEAFNELSENLVDGNVPAVLDYMDKDVLDKVATNFLPSLFGKDKELFRKVSYPVILNTLRGVQARADELNDDNLKRSVRNVARVLTGKAELPDDRKPVDPELERERRELQQERGRLLREHSEEFLVSVDTKLIPRLEKMVLSGIPKDVAQELTDFDKDVIAERTIREVKEVLKRDQQFGQRLQSLIKKASRAGFSNEYKSRLLTTYLERARRILPDVRNKHLKAATGKTSTGRKTKVKEKVTTQNEQVKTGGVRVTSGRQIDTSKTSEEDFLRGKNIHLRG